MIQTFGPFCTPAREERRPSTIAASITVLLACTPAPIGPTPETRVALASRAPRLAPASLPNIGEALICGRNPKHEEVSALPNGFERHVIDTQQFPDAICNNGSPAALYYRRYAGAENENRWVISLRGGGACSDGGSCAARWCSCHSWEQCTYATELTGFDRRNMLADGPDWKYIRGISTRDPLRPNPLAGYNQVVVEYCSSDLWIGQRRAAPLSAVHPKTGVPTAFSVHFLGARIFDATISILRQDGATALEYGAAGALPDLDAAREVILAGDSAGGGGVTFHLDALATLLREHHGEGRSRGASLQTAPPEVLGLIDSGIGPSIERLMPKAPGSLPYPAYLAQVAGEPSLIGARRDHSCEGSTLAEHPPRCADLTHVVIHHVTTPFFVRMSLFDRLISANYAALGLVDPDDGQPLTSERFGGLLAEELRAFEQPDATIEEPRTLAPGAFGPACFDHDGLHDDAQIYGVNIQVAPRSSVTFFDVFTRWRAHGAGPHVVTGTVANTHCEDGQADVEAPERL